MAFLRKTSMQWEPITCDCVIEYGLYRDDALEFVGAYSVPETIVAVCAAHAAAVDAAALDALIAPENEALAMAYGAILDITGPGGGTGERNNYDDDGLWAWSINESRQVLITVKGASALLQSKLALIPNLVPTYT